MKEKIKRFYNAFMLGVFKGVVVFLVTAFIAFLIFLDKVRFNF